MAFESCTVHLKKAPFVKSCRTSLGQHYSFCSFGDISFPSKKLCLQIIAQVRKITKSVKFDLTFIFIELSETVKSFVKSFIETHFY